MEAKTLDRFTEARMNYETAAYVLEAHHKGSSQEQGIRKIAADVMLRSLKKMWSEFCAD